MSEEYAISNPFRRKASGAPQSVATLPTRLTDGDRRGALLDRKGPELPQSEIKIDPGEPPTPQPTSPDSNRFSAPRKPLGDSLRLADTSRKPPVYHALRAITNEDSRTDPFDSASEDGGDETVAAVAMPAIPIPMESLVRAKNVPFQIPEAPPNPFRAVPDSRSSREFEKTMMLPPLLPKRSPSSRASLDMDAFKGLLMASKPAQSASGLPTSPHLHHSIATGDGGSSTDTSSISRQSIFEPNLETQFDTPRSSHELTPSDEERQRLVADNVRGKKKPPMPKTRHGKLIKENNSISGASMNTAPLSAPIANPPVPVWEGIANLNKPLPSPPPLTARLELSYQYSETSTTTVIFEEPSSNQKSAEIVAKKIPPLIPLSRRHSQLRSPKSPMLTRSLSTRPASKREFNLSDTAPKGSDVLGIPIASKPPPPPPPTRRTGGAHGRSSSVLSASISEPSEPLPKKAEELSVSHKSLSAPPPPARAKYISSTNRPAHSSPVLPAEQPTQASPTPSIRSGFSKMPPPPLPPPRQRGSSRSSLEKPNQQPRQSSWRSSSAESTRRDSDLSLRQVEEPHAKPPTNPVAGPDDIMAGINALQREVDELMEFWARIGRVDSVNSKRLFRPTTNTKYQHHNVPLSLEYRWQSVDKYPHPALLRIVQNPLHLLLLDTGLRPLAFLEAGPRSSLRREQGPKTKGAFTSLYIYKFEMPSILPDEFDKPRRSYLDQQAARKSYEKPHSPSSAYLYAVGGLTTGNNLYSDYRNSGESTDENGRPTAHQPDKLVSRPNSARSISSSLTSPMDYAPTRVPRPLSALSRSAPVGASYLSVQENGSSNNIPSPLKPTSPASSMRMVNGDAGTQRSKLSIFPPSQPNISGGFFEMPPTTSSSWNHPDMSTGLHAPSSQAHRISSPPAFTPNTIVGPSSPPPLQSPGSYHQLRQRHTLQVPRISTSRNSREYSTSNPNYSEDVVSSSGRFSPTESGRRRPSITLGRRMTRSVHSDGHVDEVQQDEDATRWADAIRNKRASKRKKKEEEDDDRVIVGTKVDQNHVNWVTAYNMLTGIRFTVSRTNAKIDRALTDADFDSKHKFSFDMQVFLEHPRHLLSLIILFSTGNELTPSARYDFKFKDYAPWVFRHLRSKFMLDPADYLMSLTSKYILSELGSPGKSGSFFYFSRDYKYIIKTIHHAEHKFLRKILRDYYNHVQTNPNTLLSQFYGLHRVKIPYGRKIHFVVMNNLFPPHRDIHTTFDLKGSTIGRDYKEEDLERNPRATLKDLNWLRRNLHLEFGPTKRDLFLSQMKRDVDLLKHLKIMDYSLLVGVHDLEKGNEDNLRDKTLQVFQPGGERSEEPQPNMLTRTPSKLENLRKARELRELIKKEKPMPMDQVTSKMPDQMLEDRKHFTFYGDDGGFRATHEDDHPGEEIYYLGIIDCLTHYGIVKKAENFWKGLSHQKSLISPIPPEGYGDRFSRFITAITMTKEEADRQAAAARASGQAESFSAEISQRLSRSSTDRAKAKADKKVILSEKIGAHEPDRTISTVRSSSSERAGGTSGTILPVVDEAGEANSSDERSRQGSFRHERDQTGDDVVGIALSTSQIIDTQHPHSPSQTQQPQENRPLTPPKDERKDFGQPQTPKATVSNRDGYKTLPTPPTTSSTTSSPATDKRTSLNNVDLTSNEKHQESQDSPLSSDERPLRMSSRQFMQVTALSSS
ncbi:MAG: Phosphatidylinositol-4-phosphate 5-kinase [Trizodia sp. TS-e1964]|nr:MAG: Phosphatidylinositol-4-phosphate 5-kinase [Trizodia sp. TS-e1964]